MINGSIPAGSASATVTVNVRGDGAIEPNEAFTLTITGATNSASAPTTVNADQDVATGRILTDDVIGTDIDGVTILETAELLHGSVDTPEANNAIQLVRLGTFTATNNGSGGNAEVVSFDPGTDQLFILNAIGDKIEIVQIGGNGQLEQDRADRSVEPDGVRQRHFRRGERWHRGGRLRQRDRR